MPLDPKKQQKASDFLKGILAFVPEASKAQAAELFQSLGNSEQAAEAIAASILRQEDYSRQMNDASETLKGKQTELDELVESLNQERKDVSTWWDANRAALEDPRVKTALASENPPNPNPPPSSTPSTGDFLTRKDVEEMFKSLSSQAVDVIETYNALSLEHFKTFGEALTRDDFERIRKHPSIAQSGLVGAWRATFKDRFDAKAQEALNAEHAKWREEGKKEALDEYTRKSGPPYVVPGSPSSVLDLLEQPVEAQQAARAASAPEALARQYMQKVAETSPDDAGWFGG